MRNFKDIIIEKLKVTKNSSEFTFTWDEFVDALYKFSGSAFWLEDLPNIHRYKDLPDFAYEGKIVKVVALVMLYDFSLENKTVNLLYSSNEANIRNYMIIHNLNELNSILDLDLISEIYRIISK